MKELWIQYGYDDTDNAPIIQTAESEDEAEECDFDVMDGCVWYRYEIAGTKLINPHGPVSFSSSSSSVIELIEQKKGGSHE